MEYEGMDYLEKMEKLIEAQKHLFDASSILEEFSVKYPDLQKDIIGRLQSFRIDKYIKKVLKE